MKRIALALTVVVLGGCQKADQQHPAQQAQMSQDTSHMMADTSHKMMADTAKAAPAKPAAKPTAKKKRRA